MQERVRGVWPRIRIIGMRAGVLVLLFYGTSFYTRDWRALVPQAGPTGPGQVASRPEVVAGSLSAHLGEAPARLEPETTGALPRTAEVVARRSAAVRAKRPSATARLTTRRDQSGEVDDDGHISRRGDTHLRGLLYEAATVLLTRTSAESSLRTWGLKLKERIGFKRAAVAVARKLAVVMHAMLRSGQLFDRTAGVAA